LGSTPMSHLIPLIAVSHPNLDNRQTSEVWEDNGKLPRPIR